MFAVEESSMMSMMARAIRTKPTLPVPPWASMQVANTEAEKAKRYASEVSTDGAVYRTEAYWTYVLDVETQGQCHEVTLAFSEVRTRPHWVPANGS